MCACWGGEGACVYLLLFYGILTSVGECLLQLFQFATPSLSQWVKIYSFSLSSFFLMFQSYSDCKGRVAGQCA